MLGDGEVDGEESRSEGGAEGVAVHEGYLSADGLMLQEVLLRGDHVRQYLLVGLHDGRHSLASDGGQQLQAGVRLGGRGGGSGKRHDSYKVLLGFFCLF